METTEKAKDFTVELREASAQYLPEDLETMESQRRLLQQLAQVVPPVSVCASKAERDYWPRAEKGELPLAKAAALCAADVNNILRITVVENLNLEGQTEENLLKTWGAADYYCEKLEENQGASLRDFLAHLNGILREKKETHRKVEELAAMISAMEQLEAEKTAPADDGDALEKTVPVIETTITGEARNQNLHADTEQAGQGGRKPGKKLWLLLIPAVAAILLIVLMPMLSKVSQVEKTIESIGVVSLSSGEAIAAAEESYSALSESQQAKVENYSVLAEARAAYDRLVTEDAIESIGKVTMESEEAIQNAEALYAALSAEQQKKIGNYRTLTAARKEFGRLTAAVNKAIKNIDAIGTVDLDSGYAIKAARMAYDALAKDNLQSYVSDKAKVLTDAEAAYVGCVSMDLYGKAMELYEAGKLEEALEQFSAITQEYSGTTAAAESKNAAQDCRMTLAENACNKGDHYTAMKLLKEMDTAFLLDDSVQALREKVLDKLEKARPRNGHKFADKVGWGWCELKVTAGAEDVCVKIISTEDSANYMMFYVRAGESTDVSIKNGDYNIVFTTGDYWYSKDVGFGDDAAYQCTSGRLSLTSWRSGSYVYYYKYELNLKNSSQSDFSTHICAADEFWK